MCAFKWRHLQGFRFQLWTCRHSPKFLCCSLRWNSTKMEHVGVFFFFFLVRRCALCGARLWNNVQTNANDCWSVQSEMTHEIWRVYILKPKDLSVSLSMLPFYKYKFLHFLLYINYLCLWSKYYERCIQFQKLSMVQIHYYTFSEVKMHQSSSLPPLPFWISKFLYFSFILTTFVCGLMIKILQMLHSVSKIQHCENSLLHIF